MLEIKFKLYLQHEETGNITSVVFDYAEIFSGGAKEILERDYKRYYVIGKGQYTNLKDRNGKEIYGSDILQTDYFPKPQIVSNISGMQFELNTVPNNDDWSPFKEIILDVIEIIGNIYENPELIEK